MGRHFVGEGAQAGPVAGDFDAFYVGTVRYVWRVLGRAGIYREAERQELAQDAYIIAHQKRATRNPAVSERLWVGTIARNLARRFRALERTRKEVLVDEPDKHEPRAPGATPEDTAILRRGYVDVMAELDDQLCEVFELYEVDGFTLDEIAVALDCPQGTVSTRLRRAREQVTAAHARRSAALPLLLPFGAGAWAERGALFDDGPADLEARIWRGVSRSLTAASMTGAAAGVVASKAAAGAAFGAGFVLGGGAVGLLVALHVFEVRPTPAPPIARAPEVVAVAPEAPAASVPSVDVPAATAPAPVAATPLHSGAPAPATSIDPEEARILGRAQSALTRGNRDAARAALDEHARRFPRGALAAERDRLRAGLDAATTGQPDAGRAPHRLMGTDD
jgi:RNA polymerase sigma-70 factor (ECF subfamily)